MTPRFRGAVLGILGGFLLTGLPLSAEPAWETGHEVRRLTHEDGLPAASVLAQGPDGYLWIGTLGGVFRFDGQVLEPFLDARGRPHGSVGSLGFDTHRTDRPRLWIGSSRGAIAVDLRTAEELRIPYRANDPETLSDPDVKEILPLGETTWVGTRHGLNRLGPDLAITGRWLEHPQEEGPWRITALLADEQGLLVGSSQGLHRFRPATDDFEPIPWHPSPGARAEPGAEGSSDRRYQRTRYVTGMAHDRQGRVLVGTRGGLFVLDPEHGGLVPETRLGEHCPEWQDALVLSIRTSPSGRRVLAGGPGVARIEAEEDRITCFGDLDLPHLQTTAMEDREGHLWAADNYGAISWIPGRNGQPGGPRRAAPLKNGEAVWSHLIRFHDNGEIWSLLDGRITRLMWQEELRTLGTLELGRYLDEIPQMYMLSPAGQGLWISFRHEGVAHIDLDTGRVTRFRPQDPWPRLSYTRDAGELWVAHADIEVCRLSTGTCEGFPWYIDDQPMPAQGAWSIFQDTWGTVWAGAGGGGLYRLVDRRWQLVRSESDPRLSGREARIDTMTEDARGHLWLGTRNAGIKELDPEGRLVRKFDHGSVQYLAFDDRGLLWIYGMGLARLDPATGEIRHFDSTLGMPMGWARSFAVNGDTLMVVTAEELHRFSASELVEEELSAPPVHLHRLRVGNEWVRPRPGDPEARLTDALRFTDRVTFGPEDSLISFELSSPYFTAPQRQRFRYRLDGPDEPWLETSLGARRISFTRLPPGRYDLQVQASNGSGRWGPETRLAIRVKSPWWQSSVAYLAYALALVGLVLTVQWGHRRKLARERRLNLQLQELDRVKDDFLANTSHELRTPLFGIIGLAEALADREEELPERSQRDLELIISSGRRLTALVDDVLDFSKLRRQREPSLATGPVDVYSAVDVVLTLSATLAEERGIELVNRVSRALAPVRADEGRLQQILHNLLGNAIRFTEVGSVEVSAEIEDGQIVIAVSDTGPGIPKADRERIFRSFEQGSSSDRREHGGTGLGLAISRQLVALQGGELWLDSEVGEGSTFRFSLPTWTEDVVGAVPSTAPTATAKAVPTQAVPTWEISGRRRSPVRATIRPASMADRPVTLPMEPPAGHSDAGPNGLADGTRMTLLVVDDDPINLRVLDSYLSPSCRVLTANSGFEALKLLDRESVDLVLLDIMMPKMSGYEVCRHIRRTRSLEEMPILFLTARSQAGDRTVGFAEGANDYLVKPVDRAELLARVGKEIRLLKHHRGQADEIHALSGMLPICASCKRVRDNDGYWEQIECFISDRTDAQFSHGYCPNCLDDLYDLPPTASVEPVRDRRG